MNGEKDFSWKKSNFTGIELLLWLKNKMDPFINNNESAFIPLAQELMKVLHLSVHQSIADWHLKLSFDPNI